MTPSEKAEARKNHLYHLDAYGDCLKRGSIRKAKHHLAMSIAYARAAMGGDFYEAPE